MKTFKKVFLAASLLLVTVITATAANYSGMKPIYIFGFSASFNDSTIYFTDIQHIDSAWIENKTKFLLGRENYSYQLRDYLSENKSQPHRTCVVVFAFNKKDINKKLANMKKKYIGKNTTKYDIKYLTSEEFSFKQVDMSPVEEEVAEQPKAKKEKKGKHHPDGHGPGTPPNGGQGGSGGGTPPMR